jgi:hypothetical protein
MYCVANLPAVIEKLVFAYARKGYPQNPVTFTPAGHLPAKFNNYLTF